MKIDSSLMFEPVKVKAVAFARNPMSLAYLVNNLQNLSEGRFILGLCARIRAPIERRSSMPWSKPWNGGFPERSPQPSRHKPARSSACHTSERGVGDLLESLRGSTDFGPEPRDPGT